MIKYLKGTGFALCIALVLLSFFIHYHFQGTMITDEATYDIITKAENSLTYDPLVEKMLDMKSSFLIKPFLSVLGYEGAIFTVSIILLVLTLAFIYPLLKKNYMFLFVLGLSPFFLKSFTSFSDFTLIAFLISAASFFLFKKMYIPCFAIHVIVSYINFNVGLVIFAVALYFYAKREINFPKLVLFIIPIIWFIDFSGWNKFFFKKNLMERLFVEFGSAYGLTITITVMAFAAIYIFWKGNKLLFYILIASIVSSFINLESGLFMINIVVVYLSSILLLYLIENKWEINLLKTISLLLIFCSMIFSATVFLKQVGDKNDYTPLHEGLIWFKENSNNDDTIFSHYKYGFRIKFFSERKVLLDNDLRKIRSSRQKYDDSITLLKSRNIDNTKMIIEKYSIDFIMITNEMKQGLVWNKEDQGLMFIMNNNPEFKKVFENSFVQIYYYQNSLPK